MPSCQTEERTVACAIKIRSYESNGRVTGGIMSMCSTVCVHTNRKKKYTVQHSKTLMVPERQGFSAENTADVTALLPPCSDSCLHQ